MIGSRDIAPLNETTSSQKRWGMARAARDLTLLSYTPTRLSANGMNHAFAFTAEAGPHFTDPGGMEGWVDLVGWLRTWFTRPKTVGHPSSTNGARYWLTSLIRPTPLTITSRRQQVLSQISCDVSK